MTTDLYGPGAVPHAGIGLLDLEEACPAQNMVLLPILPHLPSLREHGGRVGVQFDCFCEQSDGLLPFSLVESGVRRMGTIGIRSSRRTVTSEKVDMASPLFSSNFSISSSDISFLLESP